MAHMIYDNQIAYSGETPWHGLGTRVVPGTSPEDMLRAANLNWQVEMRSLAVSQTLADGTSQWSHAPMTKFKAVMRSDNGACFGVPTKKYQPVQNIEVARFFADFADASAAELQVLGALEGGRKVWALAKVNADYALTDADRQLGYVMLATSHDGSLRTVAMGTSVYVVCWNTMQSALARVGGYRHVGKTDSNKALYSLKHTGKFDASAKQEASKVVGLVREQQAATAEMAQQFARVRLDGQGRIEFVRRLLGGQSILEQVVSDTTTSLLDQIVSHQSTTSEGRNAEETRVGRAILDSILESPGAHLDGRKNTLWGAINGVTYWVDHERGRTQDSTLSGAWFGQGANLKADAVRVAYDMTGTR